jgi:2-polyprenyl-3-methyl-5-hydroxy-6-metoxy-1,4-benzoquinol methylase
MNFSEHNCDWCGSDQYTVIFQGKDLLMEKPGVFQFVRCDNCGLQRQNPRLNWSDLVTYYEDGYLPHIDKDKVSRGDKKEKFVNRYGLWKRVKFISKNKSFGKWLDVGCGAGRLLQEASRWNNWQLVGLEPIAEVAHHTSEKLNITVHPFPFEQLDETENSKFDIITMMDVLEHLPLPTHSLNHVSNLLKDDGVFIFSIPNYHSIDRRIFKKYWIGYDLPRHLYVYPHDILRKMLSEAGMSLIDSKCIAGTHAAFFLSLRFYNQKAQSKLLSNVLKIENRIFPWRLLTLLPFWIIDKLKLSTNITFVAKKNG